LVFVVIITYGFIRPEEQHMERGFGPACLDLKKRVQRWL
jgi:hypothetical protein